jgi:hypothetical protein
MYVVIPNLRPRFFSHIYYICMHRKNSKHRNHLIYMISNWNAGSSISFVLLVPPYSYILENDAIYCRSRHVSNFGRLIILVIRWSCHPDTTRWGAKGLRLHD